MSFRLQNEELDNELKKVKAEAENLTKMRRPLELEVARLKADIDNKTAEVKMVSSWPCSFSRLISSQHMPFQICLIHLTQI